MLSEVVEIDTRGRDLVDLTARVRTFCSNIGDGLLNIFVPHATAGIAIIGLGDGSEPDFAELIERLLPKDRRVQPQSRLSGTRRRSPDTDAVLPFARPPRTWRRAAARDVAVRRPRRQERRQPEPPRAASASSRHEADHDRHRRRVGCSAVRSSGVCSPTGSVKATGCWKRATSKSCPKHREGVGVVAAATVRIGGISTRDRIRVDAWEPERHLGIEHLGWVGGRGDLRLTDLGGGRRVSTGARSRTRRSASPAGSGCGSSRR